MDALDDFRTRLHDFFVFLRLANIRQTHPAIEEAIRAYSEMVDDMLVREPGVDVETIDAINDDFFMYRFAPPNFVVRNIDTNRVDITRRRISRRVRRRAAGKENKRPRQQQQQQ